MAIIVGNQEVCEIIIENSANENNDTNKFRMNKNKTTTSKYFEYKIKVIGTTSNYNKRLDAEVVVPLKYLSNFWRSLDLPLINCEIVCHGQDIVLYLKYLEHLEGFFNPLVHQIATTTTSALFQINNAKIYVSVVTLSINDNIKF